RGEGAWIASGGVVVRRGRLWVAEGLVVW
ncbi:hypothetical protein TIFTF001_011597, partial [Ficus carica]